MNAAPSTLRGLRLLGDRAGRLTLGECMIGVAIAALYCVPVILAVLALVVYFAYPLLWFVHACAGVPIGGRRGSITRRLAVAVGALVLFNWMLFLMLTGLSMRFGHSSVASYLLFGWFALPVFLFGFLLFALISKGLRWRRWVRAVRELPPPEEEIRWL